MLKKILILALTLNTTYILPTDSCSSPGSDLAASCIVLAAGIMCAWAGYKASKKMWQTLKEEQNQIKILNEMGLKVYRVSKCEFEYGSVVSKEHYTMDIPSSFSEEQKIKAKAHWDLLLTNEKKSKGLRVGGLTAVSLVGIAGGLIFIPAGIINIIKCIKF
jgi:hypothetical protein